MVENSCAAFVCARADLKLSISTGSIYIMERMCEDCNSMLKASQQFCKQNHVNKQKTDGRKVESKHDKEVTCGRSNSGPI